MHARRIVVVLGLIVGSAWCVRAQQVATTYPLSVSVVPDDPNAATYRSLAQAFNGFTGLPNSRTAFFAGYSAANGWSIDGWTSFIAAAQPNAGGALVTLAVQPVLTGLNLGVGDYVIGDLTYFETYQVNNDSTFIYVQSFDPNNQAGQVSQNIDIY